MAASLVIAVLLCAGSNCEMVQAEPGVSYPNFEQCSAALATKAEQLGEFAAQRQKGTRQVQTVCVRETQVVSEVEDPYDVLQTAIIHAAPNANSSYVGIAENGQRILVTGLVNDTNWVRVLLPDGSIGYLYGEHISKAVPRAAALPPASDPAEEQAAKAPAADSASSPVPPAQLSASTNLSRLPAEPVARAPAATAAVPAVGNNGTEFNDCPTCPVMVRLPAGNFAMGSDGDASERPVHRVAVPAFALGKSMVTVAEWEACSADGGCAFKPAQGEDKAKQPMANLSWDDANQYAQWLRKLTGKPYRLLSEAEWEYSARAGTATRYSWGDQPGFRLANCKGCGGPYNARGPADAAEFPANPWGLLGMAGGVAEWVEDCWHPSYQGAPADGSPWRSPDCSQRVLRGGSWMNSATDITVSSRNFYDSGVRYPANGVRVALGQQ